MALVAVSQCPTCKRQSGERHMVVGKAPSLATMERWISDGVARATDGCRVEPDGECSHGHQSWIRRLGWI